MKQMLFSLDHKFRYELPAVKEIAGDIPVDAIDMRDYGMMNDLKY